MASRFWVLGAGTWDASTTTNWASSSGGAGGQSVPGSADTVTFDANSGGGTVTVNTTVTVQSITCGAFTGTLDFSANNNNVTLSSGTGFSGTGAGTRTINLGNGVWTLTGTGQIWDFTTTTGLTFNANSSNITFTATSAASRNMVSGALTYATVTLSANTSGGAFTFTSTGATIGTLAVSGPNFVRLANGASALTVSNAPSWTGTSGNEISLTSSNIGTNATLSVTSGNFAATWAAFRDITVSGGSPTATSSFDLGHNSGITITAPVVGGTAMIVHPGMTGGMHG